MSTNQYDLTVREGMDVVGSDGEKLGSVARVEGNYVVASKGFFFPTDYYIPADAVSSVDGDRMYLNVTKDAALDQGWDTPPTDATYTDTDADTTRTDRGDQPFEHYSERDQGHVDDSETIRVPLSEEELAATRRQVDRGDVRVEKDVVAEEQTMDVPVTEERVNVTRRAVDRDVAPGDAAFEDDTIDVPLRGEEVDVQKRAHVREEVDITKEPVERTERVSGTVRREEAHVEGTDDDAELNRRTNQ